MGASGKLIMFHHNHWYYSSDGGHNFIRGNLPGSAGGFDYVRKAGSRTEPAGTCFALMNAPPPPSSLAKLRAGGDNNDGDDDDGGGDDDDDEGYNWRPEAEDDVGDDDEEEENDPDKVRYTYTPGLLPAPRGTVKYLMTSDDFGKNWTWVELPAKLQAGGLAVDPTRPSGLFAITEGCLAHSDDRGDTWSACSSAAGLSGKFSKLLVKDSKVMFMLRKGAVPLRTTDGGSSWQELTKCAPLFAHGATLDGSLSWSGSTLVLHGADLSAIGRAEYATVVWKSHSDGDDWVDETGDLVTISPGPGMWFEEDFYLVTRGEGVTVKRNFDTVKRNFEFSR